MLAAPNCVHATNQVARILWAVSLVCLAWKMAGESTVCSGTLSGKDSQLRMWSGELADKRTAVCGAPIGLSASGRQNLSLNDLHFNGREGYSTPNSAIRI